MITVIEPLYFVDVYASGTPRSIKGPFSSLRQARQYAGRHISEAKPYAAVVAGLAEDWDGFVNLVEIRTDQPDSEDYQAIYLVEPWRNP